MLTWCLATPGRFQNFHLNHTNLLKPLQTVKFAAPQLTKSNHLTLQQHVLVAWLLWKELHVIWLNVRIFTLWYIQLLPVKLSWYSRLMLLLVIPSKSPLAVKRLQLILPIVELKLSVFLRWNMKFSSAKKQRERQMWT